MTVSSCLVQCGAAVLHPSLADYIHVTHSSLAVSARIDLSSLSFYFKMIAGSACTLRKNHLCWKPPSNNLSRAKIGDELQRMAVAEIFWHTRTANHHSAPSLRSAGRVHEQHNWPCHSVEMREMKAVYSVYIRRKESCGVNVSQCYTRHFLTQHLCEEAAADGLFFFLFPPYPVCHTASSAGALWWPWQQLNLISI